MAMEKSDLEKGLGFLLYDVSRLLRRDFDKRVQHLGLTQVQWRAITFIRVHEGIKQVRLADYLEIRPITLTRLLDRLQESGWIERKPDQHDRRALRLYVTDKALDLLENMYEHVLQTRKLALAGISPEEYKTLTALLQRIKNNLKEEMNGDKA